jgi:DNA repair protein SbcD/Mre11
LKISFAVSTSPEGVIALKILHTSDWHLGRSLYGKKRYDEFAAFLDWLIATIKHERIDILLVAGDVFDNSTPGNRAQELYYDFLCNVATSTCRHVVITAGNHDSPSFLDAPKTLLRALNVHVIGSVTNNPDDEVMVLDGPGDTDKHSSENKWSVIVCAVPYLRDTDIRSVSPGESIDEKYGKLTDGIRRHYAAVCDCAERKREQRLLHYTNEQPPFIPIIAMGHLFTAGGMTVDGDGVRELYVGSLAHTGREAFPTCIDYLALGHLHIPQVVGENATMRYSGAPLAMGFGEARREKSVVIIECKETPAVSLLPVPVFRRLVSLKGALDELRTAIAGLVAAGESAWLEICYEGDEIAGDLREQLEAAVAGSALEILRIRNNRIVEHALDRASSTETMDDLSPEDVFIRCCTANDITEEQQGDLMQSYREILQGILTADENAS